MYSEVASYEFTTLTTVPGVIKYKGAKIQLLDLPGIIEGAKDGKGRGRQVIAGMPAVTYLLLTEFEFSTVTNRPSFFPLIYGPSVKLKGHKSIGKNEDL